MTMKLALIVFVLVVFSSCNQNGAGQPEPSPSPRNPKTMAARSEIDFQHSDRRGSDDETRSEARDAVLEFTKLNLPGWEVKGIAAQFYEGRRFSMDADLEKQGHHLIVTFDVRKFFPDSGEGFWIAVPVNKFRMDRFRVLVESDLRKQMSDAQTELDNVLNPSDDN